MCRLRHPSSSVKKFYYPRIAVVELCRCVMYPSCPSSFFFSYFFVSCVSCQTCTFGAAFTPRLLSMTSLSLIIITTIINFELAVGLRWVWVWLLMALVSLQCRRFASDAPQVARRHVAMRKCCTLACMLFVFFLFDGVICGSSAPSLSRLIEQQVRTVQSRSGYSYLALSSGLGRSQQTWLA